MCSVRISAFWKKDNVTKAFCQELLFKNRYYYIIDSLNCAQYSVKHTRRVCKNMYSEVQSDLERVLTEVCNFIFTFHFELWQLSI